ncbi:MAG: transglycosylase domain-containing protein, partial [Treponema sp.]|nr:transglycosylase domain-containing protein [Treponema sp.]
MKKNGEKKKRRIPLPVKIILIILALIFTFYIYLKLMPIKGLDEFLNQQYSTRFYDCNGRLLHILPLEEGLRKEYYQLKDLPKELVQYFIKEEDSSFYYHPGINPMAIIRAAKQNKSEGRIVS